MNFFGYEIKIGKQKALEDSQPSISVPIKDDGATVVEAAVGGAYGTYVDLDQTARNEAELITRYRSMAMAPEIDLALTAIKNEAVVQEDGHEVVDLNLDEAKDVPPALSEKMDAEFDRILDLLEFRSKGHNVFMQWYVDGRINYQVLINPARMSDGIVALKYLDPRKIKKIREVQRQRDRASGAETVTVTREYFVYNDQGYENKAKPGMPSSSTVTGIRIAKDAIVYVTSGLIDETGRMVLSYLHKAIKNLNMLRAITDAALISRLARAPDRRIFYIDTGSMPKIKAEQYMKEQMARYKNRLVYDSTTGQVKDDRKFTTMLEDIWLPRREGSRGTEIQNLPGLQNDGISEDVKMFQKMLNRSLNVPVSRLEPEAMMTGLTGRIGEITREEVDFGKFIDQLRTKFSELFTELLGRQMIMKRMVTPDEWEQIKPKVKYKWARDNSFAEQKDIEILNLRTEAMNQVKPYVGMYVSNYTVRKTIWRQTDEDMRNEDQLIAQEASNPQYMLVDPETQSLIPPPLLAGPPIPMGMDVGPGGAGNAPPQKQLAGPKGKPPTYDDGKAGKS